MTKRLGWILGFAALGAAMATTGCRTAVAAGETEAPREIQLTIYKEDFALVRESRPESLQAGRNRIHLDTVSKALDPNTVMFDWLGAGQPPNVVSSTYDLGVASGGGLIQRLEGKPVEVLWPSENGQPRDKIAGILESTGDGGFVIRAGDRLYVNPKGTIVAAAETNLAATPRLSVEVDSPTPQNAKLGLAYQTRGMSWTADYVGRLTPDASAMELECWATVANQTGIEFPAAKITLVAGSPNRAARSRSDATLPAQKAMNEDREIPGTVASPMNSAQSVGELYAYAVPALARIGQDQMNRVKMLSSTRVPIVKDYSVRLPMASAYEWDSGGPARLGAQLAISFVDEASSGLGMPLPSGAVRVYDSGAYVGAASLDDTPKGGRVNLALSKVFDVWAETRTVSKTKVDKRTVRITFEAVLRNEKKAPVDLRLVQGFYGMRKLVKESSPGKSLGAQVRQWTVRVDPSQSKTLTWSADFSS